MDESMLIVAFIIASVSCLASFKKPIFSFPMLYDVLGTPLVAGFIVGWLLNDISVAIVCSIAIQILYWTSDGDEFSDHAFSTYASIVLAVLAGGYPWIAVLTAYFLKFLFQLVNVMLRDNKDMTKKRSEQYVLYVRSGIKTLLIFLFVFSTMSITAFIANFPEILTDFLMLVGMLLPAVGIAKLLATHVKHWIYLLFAFIGFMLAGPLGFNVVFILVNGILLLLAIPLLFPSKTVHTGVFSEKKPVLFAFGDELSFFMQAFALPSLIAIALGLSYGGDAQGVFFYVVAYGILVVLLHVVPIKKHEQLMHICFKYMRLFTLMTSGILIALFMEPGTVGLSIFDMNHFSEMSMLIFPFVIVLFGWSFIAIVEVKPVFLSGVIVAAAAIIIALNHFSGGFELFY